MTWTTADLPVLEGRRVIVTGSNAGLGFEAVKALALAGAHVTLAVRDLAKGAAASAEITSAGGRFVQVSHLDVADQASVRSFADRWSQEHPEGLDLLINNAGIMAIPRRMSVDGFELQLATNHLGHFALTALLMPAIMAVPNSRIVNVASNAHKMVKGMNFEDLMGAKKYGAWNQYGQSKLANLLFTAELQRRLTLVGSSTKAMVAHPGYSATNLTSGSARLQKKAFQAKISDAVSNLIGQDAQQGVLPILFAATAPGLAGNSYVGPDGWKEWKGKPRLVGRTSAANNMQAARELWDVSEALTGVHFPLDA
jgi:NAD(P)-dependent dehydrogenase (short-subunit alcohol dehydrogenase family)